MKTGDLDILGAITSAGGFSSADGETAGDAGDDLSLTAGSGNAASGDGGSVNITSGAGITAAFILTSQDETDYNNSGDNGTFVGGDGGGGTAYVAADTITLSDGTLITVDVVDGNDDVQDFTVTTSGLTTVVAGVVLTQSSTSGTGTDFTLTPESNNITAFSHIGGDIVLTPGVGTGGGSAGAIVIPQTIAPTVTSNKLYNVSGAIIWDGVDLTAAVGIGTETAQDDILIGTGAGANLNASFSSENVLVGVNAGNGITNGDQNTAIGHDAMADGTPTGVHNVAIGFESMHSAAMALALSNIGIGFQTLSVIANGARNVVIGESSGRKIINGDDNVVLGPLAGPTTDVSDGLFINTSESDTPLIGGSFSTGIVTFSGALRFTERADHIGSPTATFGELWVRNDGPNVLVFTDDAGTDTVLGDDTVTTNTQSGTTYTAILSDAGKMITLDNGSSITMTIPANSSVAYPIGTQLNFMQLGAGQVTVTITDDTLDVESSLTLLLLGQFAVATAFKVTATTWVLFGDLEVA